MRGKTKRSIPKIDEESKNDVAEKQSEQTLYQDLGIENTVSKADIKKAYYKLALVYHPDKNKDDEQAKEKFQKIVNAYTILSDDKKRKLYDETGSYEEYLETEQFNVAYEFFRQMYKKVETQNIEDFSKNYKKSNEEEEDLIKYYKENKGDITLILESIMLSNNDDANRFVQKYDELIKEKKIKHFKIFDKSKTNIKQLQEEKAEAEELNQSLNELKNSMMLKAQNRQQDFYKLLEEKYAEKPKKYKKKIDKQDDEILEKKKKKN